MTHNDKTVIEMIRAAAERIPIEPIDVVFSANHGSVHERCERVGLVELRGRASEPTRFRRAAVLGLVAASMLLVAGALIVRGTDRTVHVTAQSVFDAPTDVPLATPEPGTVLPSVANPPSWFGTARPGARPGGDRTGRWTVAAIGSGSEPITSPINISVTDGTFGSFGTVDNVSLNGRAIRVMQSSGFTLLATTSTPTVVVSGAVDRAILADVLAATTAADRNGKLVLGLSALPPGYAVVVQPQVQAVDPPNRPTLTNADGDVAINEVSDWVNPQLAAAASGASYAKVVVGGRPAWAGKSDFNPSGSLTFLNWSPQPGVVLEITTSNPRRTIAELIQLAESTAILPAAEWHAVYG
jgi:hypothetical protein